MNPEGECPDVRGQNGHSGQRPSRGGNNNNTKEPVVDSQSLLVAALRYQVLAMTFQCASVDLVSDFTASSSQTCFHASCGESGAFVIPLLLAVVMLPALSCSELIYLSFSLSLLCDSSNKAQTSNLFPLYCMNPNSVCEPQLICLSQTQPQFQYRSALCSSPAINKAHF